VESVDRRKVDHPGHLRPADPGPNQPLEAWLQLGRLLERFVEQIESELRLELRDAKALKVFEDALTRATSGGGMDKMSRSKLR
jgi:hypothetical protein